jgi:hypothetical protein
MSLVNASFIRLLAVPASAFKGITSLRRAHFHSADSLGDQAFYRCSRPNAIDFQSAASIGEECFRSCLTAAYVMLAELTAIASQAFLNCVAIRQISMENVLEIPWGAFDMA